MRSLTLRLFGVGFLGFAVFTSVAYAADEQTVKSNYIVNPKGCMGLGEPEKDGLMLVLTFDKTGKVTDDGQIVVPEGSAYLMLPCLAKSSLEKCESKRGLFKVQRAGGPWDLPSSSGFTCVNERS